MAALLKAWKVGRTDIFLLDDGTVEVAPEDDYYGGDMTAEEAVQMAEAILSARADRTENGDA